MTTVLVTGGAGFIGSHTCVDLLEHDYEVVVVDNYSNSSPAALDRVQKIAGRPLIAYETDLRDRHGLDRVFADHPIDSVIHFAGKKAVGESMQIPLDYYDVNLGGTASLLRVMVEHGVHDLVFSSSCSIYGEADAKPLTEADPARPTNPYARSKWICEQVIGDACRRYPQMHAIALRYFNPIGAHPSGFLGEDPLGVPNNIVPYLLQVAVGRLEQLSVFGGDYDTPDGTAIRDYIHVLDVVEGHRVAMERLHDAPGLRVVNLGTGVGTSVLQLVARLSEAVGRDLPFRIVDRRPGDVPALIADPARANATWGWRARRDLSDMCRDAWRFQSLNMAGYAG
ncbi:UDP-glucose 4-epimerase GalE [Paractinoplanes rishiriensis]|uniref:UDP-glucose 4-epimerase n=1 Tax=Paractinoplanes rishiriensis TaxID=1050105 RepID=A0A919K351_9ACTN|nr:UDP-glucose 4-epimerase GalE [Actinoplanes rishiriensis]GIE98110.1 UDP-glucose 4-epimerase [Actinoplanes rishiriensis]